MKHTNAHTLRTPKHEGLYRNATAYSPFATRMDGYPLRREWSMDALSPRERGTLVSDDPAVLNLYFPCLFTRLPLPHVHQEGTVHCPCAPRDSRAPGAWRCWRTWSDMAALYSAWLRARASSRPKQSKNRPQDARPPWPPQPPPRGQRPRQRPPPLTRPPASPSNSSAAASVPSAAVTSAVEMWWREGAQGCEVGMFQSQGFHRRLRVSREWSGPPMASACGAAPWHMRRTLEGLTSRRP